MPKYIVVLYIKYKRNKLLDTIILVQVFGIAITEVWTYKLEMSLISQMILTQPCA